METRESDSGKVAAEQPCPIASPVATLPKTARRSVVRAWISRYASQMRSRVDGLASGPSTVINATRPRPSRHASITSGRAPVSAGDDKTSRTVAAPVVFTMATVSASAKGARDFVRVSWETTSVQWTLGDCFSPARAS
jgi:hypothetical protein